MYKNNTDKAIAELVPGLKEIFGATMNKLILYGSVARGTANSESDVDLALIAHNNTSEMHDRMIDFVVDLELKYDVVLSVVLVDLHDFREWENVLPFYKNVKRDGVILWSAA